MDNNSYNDTKDTQGTGKNFNNQNLDKQATIGSISNGASTTNNANTQTINCNYSMYYCAHIPATQIAQTNKQTSSKQGITRGNHNGNGLQLVNTRLEPSVSSSQYNGQNDTVNTKGFTKNDTIIQLVAEKKYKRDQIFGLDVRGTNTGTHDTGTSNENTPKYVKNIIYLYQAAPITEREITLATPMAAKK